jgi:glycosyltransferase involved in cell wall biosynthesis
MIPFGANIWPEVQINRQVLNAEVEINFLFSGVDWQRKGGDKALEIINHLRTKSINAKLFVVGCSTSLPSSSYIINYGFVDRNTLDGELLYRSLFEKSHFLLLPTIADCTPFVFCESFAYSLPVITHNVGGIKEMIESRNGGLVYDIGTDPSVIADDIFALISLGDQYPKMCQAARSSFLEMYNWNHWGDMMGNILKKASSCNSTY